jgi:hypothetical protein
MEKFVVGTKAEGEKLLVHISGHLSEEVDLTKIDVTKFTQVDIDLSNLSNIGSKGVRKWMIWIQDVAKGREVTLSNCSKVFVNMVNLVQDMVPSTISVKSIGVPYFCTKCGSTFSESLDVTVQKDNFSVAESKPCLNCGQEAELDTIVDKYFHFLEGRL